MQRIVILGLVIIVAVCIHLIANHREHFIQQTGFTTTVSTPFISAMNNIVNTANTYSKRFYCNSKKLADTISTRMSYYAESMKPYKRDDNLDMVIISRRHKIYIEQLEKQNPEKFAFMQQKAAEFYKVPFAAQDEFLIAFLTKYADYDPSIAPLVKEKLEKLGIFPSDDPSANQAISCP